MTIPIQDVHDRSPTLNFSTYIKILTEHNGSMRNGSFSS